MRITVNGEERKIADGATVSDLIRALEIEKGRVAVEVNRSIVPRSSHADHVLSEGDRVEIVTMVGGG
ncbi:MAG: sulfur carrier protein ThiS [Planctomycetota bacterium]